MARRTIEHVALLHFYLYAFQGQYSTDHSHPMAASVVVMLPLLILFFSGRKYFIQGVVIAGVKG